MSSKTIDLTDIPPNPYKKLLELPYNFDSERACLERQLHQFEKQKDASENLFSRYFRKSNEDLLSAVEEFVDSSMHIDRNSLFPKDDFNLIHVAHVILGMQVSDHATTIDMIEKRVSGRTTKLRIVKITPEIRKKIQVLNFVDNLIKIHDLLIIVERSESFDDFLLTTLIGSLHRRLQEQSIHKVMIIFCMAGSSKRFQDSTALDVLRYTREPKVIYKQTYCEILKLQEYLVANEDVDVKFGPEVIETISSNVSTRDASVTNFRYLFHNALLDHFYSIRSLVGLPYDQLIAILKSKKNFLDVIKGCKSLRYADKSQKVNSKDLVAVARYCEKQVNYLKDYHVFIQSQMSQYLELLKDETGRGLCSDLVDIYKELVRQENLSFSEMFVNAISGLKNISTEKIVSRIDSSSKKQKKLPKTINAADDVSHILLRYRKILENNPDDKNFVHDLIKDLLIHARVLKNPFMQPLCEAVYFCKNITLRARALPASRVDSRYYYSDQSINYGVLYDLIHKGPAEINLNDLFGDFVQRKEELLRPTQASTRLSGPRMKTGSRKSIKRASAIEPSRIKELKLENEDGNGNGKRKSDLDENMLKAVFLDLIESFKRQGLVRDDIRQSRNGTLKRLVWLI